jgi:hypothetical protein
MRSDAVTGRFRFLAHHPLDGFGGLGEGMAIQTAPDRRRILWLAHEGEPKNFTGVDVSDPRRPRLVVQTDLPGPRMRSNSLEVVGDVMAVAYQTSERGAKSAGFELFDVSRPEQPRSIAFFDASGPHSRGVHHLWFCDGEYIHASSGASDFVPRHSHDDQIYRIVDVRHPSRPVEVGRWWLPGTGEGDGTPAPARHAPEHDWGFRAHNTNVYPRRPDRAYLGYLDGGMIILDIADKTRPRQIARWDNSPPFAGFTHTVLPLFDRELLVVTDETVADDAADWPKLIWILDGRREDNVVPIATCPLAREGFTGRGGRFGAHNLHENVPLPTSWQSEQIIFGTFFSGGVRAYDLSDPYRPVEVAAFVPPVPNGSPSGTIQLNDVFVDERSIVYTVDRHVGGLYILEFTG